MHGGSPCTSADSGHEDPAIPGRLAYLRTIPCKVIQDTSCLLSHMAELGLKMNLEKSCLNPSQTSTFIGVALGTTTTHIDVLELC